MAGEPHRLVERRREPHRRLFPLGAGLAVVAVLPFALGGRGGGALAIFHSVAQIQGFLTCFAVGFLFTWLPRRTRTAPPDDWEMAVALAVPPAAVLCAWGDEPALASWLWLSLLAAALAFTVRRLRGRPARERFPPVLLWVPASLAAGAAGALLVAVGPRVAPAHPLEAWSIGRGLLVQGFAACLWLGVGGFLLPQLTRGEEPAGVPHPSRRRTLLALHALAIAALLASFPLEVLGDARLGFGLRALVAGGVLVGAARIHRPPLLPGLLRWLVWLAAWLVPVGFALGALGPRFRGAALHVLFVGGFAQVALAASTLVLSQGAASERRSRRTRAVPAMAGFLAAAFGARIGAALEVRHVAAWLGVAAFAFLGAVAAWAAVVGPALLAREPAPEALPLDAGHPPRA
jgi:uncharacterized protein involved in response to NO